MAHHFFLIILVMLCRISILFAEPKIHLSVERVPVERVLAMITKHSSKELILDANLRESTTLSLSNVSWREALNALMSAHDLELIETEHHLIVVAPAKTLKSSRPDKRIRALVPLPSLKKKSHSQIRITGITGNDQERIAIVEVAGINKLWKLGSSAPEGFRVRQITETTVILLHPVTGITRTVQF
ncbi:hypothetical protein HOF92_00820 [bacterium]|nr:hypothetical protein [bacterium]